MCSDVKASQALRAIAKMAEASFSKGEWLELGLVTDSQDVATKHQRLLRSLDWGDRDYPGNVLEVLPRLLGASPSTAIRGRARDVFPNLREVEEHLRLERWLAEHQPALRDDLYGGEDVAVLDDLGDAAAALGIPTSSCTPHEFAGACTTILRRQSVQQGNCSSRL